MNAPNVTNVTGTTRRYRLTARDFIILYLVARMGQATAEQVRRLCFGRDSSTALRRLRKLVTLHLLVRHVLSESSPNIYTLSASGRGLLIERGAEPRALHCAKVGRHPDEHLRRLNDVRVEFMLAGRARCSLELVEFHADLDLRRAAGSAPPMYIPDGIAELRTAAAELALMLEIDLGSEGVGVFAGKVRETVELWRTGMKCWGARPGCWRPVVFVTTVSRARTLARAITTAGGGALWLVAELDRVHAQGVLGPVFATAAAITDTPKGTSLPYRSALTGDSSDTARGPRSCSP